MSAGRITAPVSVTKTIGQLTDDLGSALERMVAIQMTAYPVTWTYEERRESAEEYLFGKKGATA